MNKQTAFFTQQRFPLYGVRCEWNSFMIRSFLILFEWKSLKVCRRMKEIKIYDFATLAVTL